MIDARKQWGLHTAKKWLTDQGFLQISDLGSVKLRADIFGLKSATGTEVAIRVETEKTIAITASRQVMYDFIAWKNENPAHRKIVLFVPAGMGQTGKELLGLYDDILEFQAQT